MQSVILDIVTTFMSVCTVLMCVVHIVILFLPSGKVITLVILHSVIVTQ